MSDEQEGGFVVRDRRRFLSDEEAAPSPNQSPAPTPPPAPSPAESRERLSTLAEASEQSPLNQTGEYETVDDLARDQIAEGSLNPAAFENEDEGFDPAELMGEAQGQGDAGMQEIPDVYSMLLVFLEQLRGLAIVYMGLSDHPALAGVAPDLAQARTAINTATFVASQLDPVLAPEDKVQLKAMISDLQVAFVEIGKRQAAEAQAPSPFAVGNAQSPAGQGGFGGNNPGGGRGNAGGGGFMGGMMGGGNNPSGGPPPRRRG